MKYAKKVQRKSVNISSLLHSVTFFNCFTFNLFSYFITRAKCIQVCSISFSKPNTQSPRNRRKICFLQRNLLYLLLFNCAIHTAVYLHKIANSLHKNTLTLILSWTQMFLKLSISVLIKLHFQVKCFFYWLNAKPCTQSFFPPMFNDLSWYKTEIALIWAWQVAN